MKRANRIALPETAPGSAPEKRYGTCSTCFHFSRNDGDSEPCVSCVAAWEQDHAHAPGWLDAEVSP